MNVSFLLSWKYRAIQKSFYQVSHDIIIIYGVHKIKKCENKNIRAYGQANETYF
jgi:hypothetical protein